MNAPFDNYKFPIKLQLYIITGTIVVVSLLGWGLLNLLNDNLSPSTKLIFFNYYG